MDVDRGQPSVPAGPLNWLRLLSLVDGLLLVALVFAAVRDRDETVGILGPTHGLLFLLLIATLAWAASQGWWRWRFVAAVAILGPLASVPGLERIRLRQRSDRRAASRDRPAPPI